MNIDRLDFEKLDGLIPAIVQDAATHRVLMLGFMNRAALELTLADGLVTFWSRSRNTLWRKGETSGNTLAVVSIDHDCDCDALLIRSIPAGPACHTGAISCFANSSARRDGPDILAELERTVLDRRARMPEGSYTVALFAAGRARMAQKVGEEGVEVVIAALERASPRIAEESADLLYHLLVLLVDCGHRLEDVSDILRARFGGGVIPPAAGGDAI
ncbi:MAG: bifunctional phosphoribosyl-AMP cyclohydrolase/phosphoribosyl-ATP diphosphatase HisIE [Chlorobi bacterium]|nr:bifunctional phosphoribosyl-AMP cyclohydrolase/phosphoribosyl-ATP diphosphatase HisIE [Chlorobiota bacterium]